MRDPFTWSFPIGRLFGITIRIHLSGRATVGIDYRAGGGARAEIAVRGVRITTG